MVGLELRTGLRLGFDSAAVFCNFLQNAPFTVWESLPNQYSAL